MSENRSFIFAVWISSWNVYILLYQLMNYSFSDPLLNKQPLSSGLSWDDTMSYEEGLGWPCWRVPPPQAWINDSQEVCLE